MENFLFNLGLSFTLSKLFAYLFFVVFGALLTVLFIKKSKNGKMGKIPKLLISFVLFVAPFLIYFTIHPIYVGDFSNNSYAVESKAKFPTNKQITVIALANCPYCIQSTETCKLLKKKNPSIKIEYWVLSNNIKYQLKYKKLLGNAAHVKLKAQISTELVLIAKGSFPTFVLSDQTKAIKAWNNDSFGVMAMDEVCDGF
ncbi:MAG: hypothetical protein FGM14_07980 [Flavobacteriales bacterium]|nr:hypothetical protein [Flavobacteriales bacterium]